MRGRRRVVVAIAVAVVAGAVAVALAVVLRHESKAPELRHWTLPAEAFLDSVGVATHFSYVDTAYARQAELLTRIAELGARHIRDSAPPPTGPLADGLRAARATGIKGTLHGDDPGADPTPWVTDAVAAMGDGLEAVEAPNELDNSEFTGWPAQLRTYMPALADAAKRLAPGADVIGPSFIDPSSRAELDPNLPGLFNGHPYAGGEPPEPALDQAVSEWHVTAKDRGAVFTEAGYHNALSATTGQPPASEQVAADYMPRLLMTAFGAGVQRTFIYELVDEKPDPGLLDPEQHFGLLRNDLSPKPAFTAVKTLIGAVRSSPGPHSGPPLGWRMQTEDNDRVEALALKRPDGSLAIALWRPVSIWNPDSRTPLDPGSVGVELGFGASGARDVQVWRPSRSALPVRTEARAQRLRLDVAGDLVLVSLR